MICEDEKHEASFPNTCKESGVPNDLVIFKQLNKAKFTIFNAHSPSLNKNFAVKVFPYQNNQVSPYFIKETYFMSFKHQNIISIIDYKIQQSMPSQGGYIPISYIIMELATYGDFFDVIMKYKIKLTEKLARTYFHQLVAGVEYIHSRDCAHLDLKLENLLLGNDFQLKVADFDTAYIKGQAHINSKGTMSYRAPELQNCICKDPQAADIYSMGIILFLFQCGGKLPYREQATYNGFDFLDLLTNNKPLFWTKHCEAQRRESSFFSEDFKTLFESMVEVDPLKRATIAKIKSSKWYNGEIFTDEELQYVMPEHFKKLN